MAEPGGARRSRAWNAAGGVLLWAVLTAACGGSGTATQPSVLPTPKPTPTPPPKVAVLSVDGLRPDALTPSGGSNILGLAQRGSYTWEAQTTYPSTTLPGHVSMLTGVEPATHGITFDEYRETVTLGVPTVFSLVRASGRRAVMVVGKAKLKQLAAAGTVDTFVLADRGDVDVANEAIGLLPAGFDLLFIHLPQTDYTGHACGWMSAEYLAQVREADAAVGRVLSALPPETTVILTADHGGQSTTHGTRDHVDMTIPWIIAGPRVVRRGPLTQAVRTQDTAVTILHLLGIAPPSNVAGRFVSEPFESQ